MEYEMDELHTYVNNKANNQWVIYAINKDTKEVADFVVGRRKKNVLRLVADTVILSNPRKIYTDKLKQYLSLLPRCIHCARKSGINHIERKNLSLRTHLKRLGRKTICFNRSIAILTACLKIYFWS